MKRLLIFLIVLVNMQLAHADQMAKIRIHISGAMGHNNYFLCLPGIGCLSIKAGQNGKTFPVLRSFAVDNMYVVDASKSYKISFQGLPSSCDRTVNTNQTITISGSLTTNGSNVKVNGLRCSIS